MIVFLSNEGVPATIFESQVLEHAEGVSQAGEAVKVVAIALGLKRFVHSRSRLSIVRKRYSVPIKLFPGVHQAVPFSGKINQLLVLLYLLALAPDCHIVHCRSEYSVFLSVLAKRFCGYQLLWDCRGDTEDEHVKKWQNSVGSFARFYSRIARKRIIYWKRVAAQHAHTCIFVSKPLKDAQSKEVNLLSNYVLPNVASQRYFFFSSSLRRSMRKELGFGSDDLVVAFVGSDAKWHCLPKMAEFLNRAMAENNTVRPLLLMDRTEALIKFIDKTYRSRVTALYVNFEKVNSYLNAADFALLLLPKDPFSWVASPVKHAEYCLAGLPVLHNFTVSQVISTGNELGNAFRIDAIDARFLRQLRYSEDERAAVSSKASQIFNSESRIRTLVKLYESMKKST